MSDPTPSDKAEARAIRRRWVTLGEAVAVAGVFIAGLTLWNSWAERRDAEAVRADERTLARAASTAERSRIGLVATESDGDTIAFKGVECALQSTDIRFPKALGVAPQFTVTVHEIEADWFAAPLLRRTDGGPDRREGRLPVLIESRCEGTGGTRQERAIYDIAWRIEPRLLRGRALRLRGMVLRERVPGDGQARLDALWTKP